jgi:hypothetical protein
MKNKDQIEQNRKAKQERRLKEQRDFKEMSLSDNEIRKIKKRHLQRLREEETWTGE